MDNPLDNDGLAAQPAPRPVPQPTPGAGVTPIAEAADEPKGHGSGKPPKKRVNLWLFGGIVAAVLVVAGGASLVITQKLFQAPLEKISNVSAETAQGPLKNYAKGSIANLITYASPRTIENIPFVDRDHKPLHLSDFKGQVVVLNVWATWCAPCRFEMPTLAHLQTDYTDKGVKVLPISVDEIGKFEDVKSFIDVQEPLQVYVDTTFAAPSKLGVSGMPATLILDKQGRAVARLDGQATWDTPEVKALIDKLRRE